MGSNSINKVSQIIEIEDDIEDVVIDLDEADKTPEEVIYEWDAKIRKKFSTFTVADNDNVLGDLMKEYLESLQEMTRSYEDNETLKNKVLSHISFLYLYYVELQCCTPDNYLSHMEDILTLYCNLVLEVIHVLKKKNFSKHKYKKQLVWVARQIIHVLTVYLLERHDHILHVLIKMNTNKISDPCSEVLNILYTHFLTKVPAFNLCDESFCRTYIVFQKWKEIRKLEEWEGMDKIMYKMFNRTPESIKNNQTLRQILMPACSSTVDIVLNLFHSFRAITGAYFKHVVAKKNVEFDDLDFNIDLGEDEPTIPTNDENEEEVEFLKAFYEVERNMSNLSYSTSANSAEIDIFRKCKEELDEDDDVQFVGITTFPQPLLLGITINNEENDFAVSNVPNPVQDDPEPPPVLPSPLLVTSTIEKSSDLENLNGITRICVGSPRTVPESSTPCETTEPPTEPSDPDLHPVPTIDATETNQPEVSFAPNNAPEANPSSPSKATEQDCDSALSKQTVEMKSVEVQADYLYNDYGLTTPPFDVQTDEQISRPEEARVYTDIGQSDKKESGNTRTVEVQVDPKDPYNDYGLTPPNEPHLEDHGGRLQEPLYADIGHKDLSRKIEESPQISTHNSEIPQIVAQENTVIETESENGTPVENHFDDFEDELEISEMTNLEELDTEEIDVESCQDNETESPAVRVQAEESTFKTSDQIDTGQKAIPNSAPNIRAPVTAESEIKDLPPEPLNGNTVLKPLVTSNRTNGQAKDSPAKIMYTSSQRIRPTTLEDFSRFENAFHSQWNKMKENHDFDDILSGPVSKVLPVKQSSLLSSQDKLDLFSESNSKPVAGANSRSNSPTDMTSPDFEAMDDFPNYYSDSVNGRVPPPHDVKVPPGILKKNNTSRRKNCRIMFHESTCDSEERKPRSDGILVPKRVRKDRKLNMRPLVVVERLSFIENKMKKVLTNPGTLRIDYDKTTPYINERDVVRCISPQKLSWIINIAPSRHTGKVKQKYGSSKKGTKCENHSSCCNQLAEEFKLNCNVCEEKALNLTIPEPPPDPESEFSNSPTFLQGTDELVQKCLQEATEAPEDVKEASSLLCDNSNFYKSVNDLKNSNSSSLKSHSDSGVKDTLDDTLLKLPTAVPESYDFDKNLKNEVFSKIDWQNSEDSDGETRLPLKKRKLSVANENTEELKKEEISYPATPMISIAEVEALHPRKINNSRAFKTPAERKEMPPLPVFYNVDTDPSPIITDQFNINNHTYNNPTINYHMNNVPVPFINIPCGSYYSLPPILVPFNNVSTFEQNKLNSQQETYVKKETRKQGRRRRQQ